MAFTVRPFAIFRSIPYVGACLTFAFLISDIVNEVPNLKMDLSLDENHQKFRTLFSNIVLRISDARQLSEVNLYENLSYILKNSYCERSFKI